MEDRPITLDRDNTYLMRPQVSIYQMRPASSLSTDIPVEDNLNYFRRYLNDVEA